MVIHPPDALSRIRGIHGAVCFRAGRADHEVSGREVDPYYAALDDGDVGISDLRNFSRRTLGLLGAGLGRLLGMGSGGERVADAVADRHCIPALGDDAGKARHAEDVERVADLLHVHAVDLWYVSDASRVWSVRCTHSRSRRLARGSWCFWHDVCVSAVWFLLRNRDALAQRASTGVDDLARVEFSVQQLLLLVACFTVLWGTLFPVLSEWVQGHQGHGWAAVFQSREHSGGTDAFVADRSGTAAGMAQDLFGEPEAQFPLAGAGRRQGLSQ